MIWKRFSRHKVGMIGLVVLILFVIVGLYAPFLASSKPIALKYDGHWYFPLFRYLFYRGYYTKGIDIFFNLLMFTLPLMLLCYRWRWAVAAALVVQIGLTGYFVTATPRDPAFQSEVYTTLKPVLRYRHRLAHHEKMEAKYGHLVEKLPTLWQIDQDNYERSLARQTHRAQIEGRRKWLEAENSKITFELMPPLRPFHWQDDAGGDQTLNGHVSWLDLTRVNRKDLVASLLFGIRISLMVGVTAVVLSLVIGIPLGAAAGYFGGKTDIILSRWIEIWEAMPTFFMLLMCVALLQSKSIFLVVLVLGLFGWTGFSRFLRGEVLKARNLAYVEACHSLGYPHRRIIFSHILPNAIPPLLTLLPFSVMAAITSEAGLSFLGLGEEGATSWGVLMDEGRSAFPAESYLLWPPAIMLTALLVAIALVGDGLRDALDPRTSR